MHEVHLVRDLVATVEKQASAQGAKGVKTIRVLFSPLISHSAEHVEFCFEVVKKDSPLLKETKLALTALPKLARCLDCGHEFEVDELPNICPKCNSVNLQPVHNTGLTLEGFEIEK